MTDERRVRDRILGVLAATIVIGGLLAPPAAYADESAPPAVGNSTAQDPATEEPADPEQPLSDPATPEESAEETPPPQETDPTAPVPSPQESSPATDDSVIPPPPADAAAAPPEATETPADATTGDITVLALPPTASDAALIAWTGGGPEPAVKVTLQQALTAAGVGGRVDLVPNASGYRFSTILQVPTLTTIAAASSTPLYGRLNVTGGGLTLSQTSIAAAANGQVQVTVNTAGAILTDVTVGNPEGFTGTTAVTVGATATGVQLNRLTVSGSATGVNLTTSAGAAIGSATITGVTTGVLVTAGSTAVGPTITSSTIGFAAKGVVLGATSGARLTGLTLTGPGAGTTYGVDYQNATGLVVDGPTITDVLHGISTSTPTTTATGPRITGGTITATGNAIGLGATAGATVDGTGVTRIEPTNNAAAVGVNVLNATGVRITDLQSSGFRDGISVAAGNTATGPTISGGSIAAVVSAIALGASTSPTVTGVTVIGQLRPAATAIATVGVELASSTGASISALTATDVARGVNAPVTNTSAGLSVRDSTITLTNAAAATGVNLGSTQGAVVADIVVTGPGRAVTRTTGITTNRAAGATIEDVQLTDLATGIGATWIRLSGRDIPGHTISRATITEAGIGIYTANTTGTTILDSSVDAWGEGIAGHEDADILVQDTTVAGHAGSTFQNGTNCVRFYYTDGITITDVTTTGGSTGLYLDMSSDAVVTRLDASGATWYGTYAESITGYELRDSAIHDNAGIGNLTINPTELDAIDHRMVSSGILFEDNTFTDNIAGLYLPLGAYDVTFQRNVVSGTRTYVILGTPVYDVLVADNQIDYTHDPSLLAFATTLSEAPSLGDPAPEPPLADEVADAAFGAGLASGASVSDILPTAATATGTPAALIVPMSPTPPPNATAAIWIAPLWYDLDTATASSDDIQVLDNAFTGDGPFIGVGTTGTVDKQTPDAPTDPSTMRTLRSTIEVSRNIFPKDSTAIVTVDNAEEGTDENTDNTMINGDAAVDARGDNDWGSPCYARTPTDGYDGGGAFIHEVRATQVLYPQGCDPEPEPEPEPGPGPSPRPVAGGGTSGLATTGGDPGPFVGLGAWLVIGGLLALTIARIRRRSDTAGREREPSSPS